MPTLWGRQNHGPPVQLKKRSYAMPTRPCYTQPTQQTKEFRNKARALPHGTTVVYPRVESGVALSRAGKCRLRTDSLPFYLLLSSGSCAAPVEW